MLVWSRSLQGLTFVIRADGLCLYIAALLLASCCHLSPPEETLQPKKMVSLTQSYLRPDHRDWVFWSPALAEGNVSQTFVITTGSLLGFSSKSTSGKLIRFLSDDRRDGFTHVGMALVAYPSEILQLVQASAAFGGLSTRTPEYTAYQLKLLYTAHPYLRHWSTTKPCQEQPAVFVFEAVSDAKLIRKNGIYSCVLLTPLNLALNEYRRDVCVRTLLPSLDLALIQKDIIQELGISYELKKLQLFRSTTDANKEEDGSSWFCSELVAHIYKTAGVLDDRIGHANNVIPKEFASYNRADLLKNLATQERWLKRVTP